MLRIEAARDAKKFIDKLPVKQERQILRKIQLLVETPNPHDSIQLQGKASAWRRIDAGEYRIIYPVEEDVLKIDAVGRRNDGQVYRDFEPSCNYDSGGKASPISRRRSICAIRSVKRST